MFNEEKRRFRRYENNSECEIRVDSETFKGRIIDYSDGIGAVFKDVPSLQLDKVVYIKVNEPEMYIKAKAVRVEQVGDELKVGFSRVEGLHGSLENFALADILIGLQRGTKTGVLIIEKGSTVKGIFIKNGDMITAYSNNREDRLGEFLLRQKMITSKEFNKASEMVKDKKEKLGRVLVELEYLKPDEVFQAVQQQMEEIVQSLIAFRNGAFKFKEGVAPPNEFITIRISAANIIYRGIKMIDSHEHIKQSLPPMDALLDMSPSPINIFQNLEVEDVDKVILSYINGTYSLEQILSLSPSEDFDTLRSISALLSVGMITVKKSDKPSVGIDVEDVLEGPEEELTKEFSDKLNEIFSQCDEIGYYDILDVDRESSDEEIRTAYYRLSKQYHPDRHFASSSDDLKEKLTRIFSNITKAYEILSAPETRAEYDRSLDVEYAATDDEPIETAAPEDEELESVSISDTDEEELSDKEKATEEVVTADTVQQEEFVTDKSETVPADAAEDGGLAEELEKEETLKPEEISEGDQEMADEAAMVEEEESSDVKLSEEEVSEVPGTETAEDEIIGETDIPESEGLEVKPATVEEEESPDVKLPEEEVSEVPGAETVEEEIVGETDIPDNEMMDEQTAVMEEDVQEIKAPQDEEVVSVSSAETAEEELVGEADIPESEDITDEVPLESSAADIEKTEEEIEASQSETLAEADHESYIAEEGETKKKPIPLIAAAVVVLAVVISITYIFIKDEPKSPEVAVKSTTEGREVLQFPAFRDKLFEEILNK